MLVILCNSVLVSKLWFIEKECSLLSENNESLNLEVVYLFNCRSFYFSSILQFVVLLDTWWWSSHSLDDLSIQGFCIPGANLPNAFSLLADSYGPNVVVSEGESAYDYCWYPYMSASSTSSRHALVIPLYYIFECVSHHIQHIDCLVFQIQIYVYSQHLLGTILFIFGMLILDRCVLVVVYIIVCVFFIRVMPFMYVCV